MRRVAFNIHIPKGNHIQRLQQICDKMTMLERRAMAQQCNLKDWMRIIKTEILGEQWIGWNVGQHGFQMQPKCFHTVHGQCPWSQFEIMGFVSALFGSISGAAGSSLGPDSVAGRALMRA